MASKWHKSPLVVLPAVVIGAYALTGNSAGAANTGKVVTTTYGTVAGVGVGSLPDLLDGFGKGVKATGGGTLTVPPGDASAPAGG